MVTSMGTREMGLAVVAMGGGRRKPADSGRPLAVVHVCAEAQYEEAKAQLYKAISLDGEYTAQPMVYEKIMPEDLS